MPLQVPAVRRGLNTAAFGGLAARLLTVLVCNAVRRDEFRFAVIRVEHRTPVGVTVNRFCELAAKTCADV